MNFSSVTQQLTPQNWPSIQKMAKKNLPHSQYLMGVAYLLGGLVDVDRDKAFHWFSRAALNKHADAAFRCGYLISTGHTDKEGRDAKYWFTIAAENGSEAGLVALGNLWTFDKLATQSWIHRYLPSQDQSPEAVEALNNYVKACAKEYPAAFYFQGLHLLKGWGAPRSKEKAQAILEEGITLRDADCAFLMAKIVGPKNDMYMNYCERAADWGHAQAQYTLANILFKRGATKPAVSWMRRSAMQRHPESLIAMSKMFYYGTGVTRDLSDAYIWARRAVESGVRAKPWLAFLYRRLDEDQKLYVASAKAQKGDSEFYNISRTLFGESVLPMGAPDA